ncbi:MAG: DUF1150 family protein [Paracoccaceae bacterium]
MTDHKTAGNPSNRAIVYVREAAPETLPPHLRDGPGKIYAVHDAAGKPLAIAPDRSQAFALARRHDFTPLSVH